MRTENLTPTWSGLLPVLLVLIEDGSDAKAEARRELQRMAQAADRYYAIMKKRE